MSTLYQLEPHRPYSILPVAERLSRVDLPEREPPPTS